MTLMAMACDPLRHTSMYERLKEDSEDSDGEGGLGNVSRVIIRPPGHSGKAKRGHICFDAAFETGNLGRADLVGEFEYDLFLRPDTCNPRYRFWFNFTVDNVRQDQRVIFNVVNINKPRNLYGLGLTPLVKSSSRPKWQRLSHSNVFFYRSAAHQNHHVMSFAFAFDKEDDVYQFAVSYPYSFSRLQSYLKIIDARPEKNYERTQIGKSLQNRNLELLTIDFVKKPIKVDSKHLIRMIIILARSHAGDAPASFVVQGLIEFLIGNHPIANILRENFVFKILPMVNPDGVFLGNNRCNLIGQDMNRTWHVTTEFSHPTLYVIKDLLKEYDTSDCYQVDFVFDLHAHTSLLGTFIYGNTYEDVYRYERHLVFPRLFSGAAHDYVASNATFNADERKIGCIRRYACEHLSDTVNAYSLEVSMYGYYLKDGKTITPYTEDGYMRVGRNLARTFLQYYRFINYLALPMVPELNPNRKRRPKTHQSRRRSRNRYEVQPRPKTTRACAPISYTDLSINYESATSDEGSPLRGPSSSYKNFPRRTQTSTYPYPQTAYSMPDQFSLMTIKQPKYENFDLISEPIMKQRKKTTITSTSSVKLPPLNEQHLRDDEILNVPPKPYLSIIDFNQLTRGSLEEAMAKIKSDKKKISNDIKKNVKSKLQRNYNPSDFK